MINWFEALWLFPSLAALVVAIRNLREATADWNAVRGAGSLSRTVARGNLLTQIGRVLALSISASCALFVSLRPDVPHAASPAEVAVIVTLLTFVITMGLLSYGETQMRDKLTKEEVDEQDSLGG